MAKIDIFNDEWCDMVFTGRNQAYGAYEVRKANARNSVLGIVLAIVLFSASVSAPLIYNLISRNLEDFNKAKVTEVTTLESPPPIDKTQPPPPDVEPPPPLKETVKFTPPVIKPDEEVPDEPPPTQEKLAEVDAGAKTQEGNDNGVDLSLIDDGNGDVIEEPDKPFTYVEQMPEFPGGNEALIKYIAEHVKYPAIARENNISGTVYLKFVVNKDGNVGEVEVLRGVGGGCTEEAKRVIKTLPRFTPGKQNGRPVPVYYNVPVKFNLL